MAQFSRRKWLGMNLTFAAGAFFRWQSDSQIPIRPLTRPPGYHWFGYYDKFQFDPKDRYVLGMAVDFEHRSPRPDDAITLGMIDLNNHDEWIPFARTTAWCWQQGCMLQWRPGSDSEVIFNDRDEDHYIARILNVHTGRCRTIATPVYALSPDGRTAVTTDFRRLGWARPGYGYNGIPDPYAEVPAPENSGIWRVDLETGKSDLILSLAEVASVPWQYGSLEGCVHWFNHLLVNPSGDRFVFLHRWKKSGGKSWSTRMLSANLDGTELRVVIDSGSVSHFIWRDARHVLAYSRRRPNENWGFFLWEDRPEGRVEPVGPGVMGPSDGHCNYVPGGEWIVCDIYPDAQRLQHVYLYHVPTNRRVELAALLSPPQYTGEWRCDTHPRVSRTGRYITVDSPHEGGRQIYLIDISSIIGKAL